MKNWGLDTEIRIHFEAYAAKLWAAPLPDYGTELSGVLHNSLPV